jgi:hypothetical protein
MDAAQACTEEKTILCGHWHCSYGHARYENKGSEFGPALRILLPLPETASDSPGRFSLYQNSELRANEKRNFRKPLGLKSEGQPPVQQRETIDKNSALEYYPVKKSAKC